MSKIILTKRTYAIFLTVIVVITGTFPAIMVGGGVVYAQPYYDEVNYNSYEQDYGMNDDDGVEGSQCSEDVKDCLQRLLPENIFEFVNTLFEDSDLDLHVDVFGPNGERIEVLIGSYEDICTVINSIPPTRQTEIEVSIDNIILEMIRGYDITLFQLDPLRMCLYDVFGI